MVDITAAKPFYSVLILAFVCSALIAGAVVGLRPVQEENRRLDRQKNILYAAGLYDGKRPMAELFKDIETRVVELKSGTFVAPEQVNPESYNQLKAALSDDLGSPIAPENDAARLKRQEKYSLVYLVRSDGKLSQVILPVRGKGLWSTMYAYVALEADGTTIRGISFYEHGETPGLGGEIENQRWQESWRGKKLYQSQGEVDLQLVKGKASAEGPAAEHQIDGLSGATLTSNGVNGLLEFWFGDHGFKPFLSQLKSKDPSNG